MKLVFDTLGDLQDYLELHGLDQDHYDLRVVCDKFVLHSKIRESDKGP